LYISGYTRVIVCLCNCWFTTPSVAEMQSRRCREELKILHCVDLELRWSIKHGVAGSSSGYIILGPLPCSYSAEPKREIELTHDIMTI